MNAVCDALNRKRQELATQDRQTQRSIQRLLFKKCSFIMSLLEANLCMDMVAYVVRDGKELWDALTLQQAQ